MKFNYTINKMDEEKLIGLIKNLNQFELKELSKMLIDPSDKVKLEIIKRRGTTIRFFDNLTDEMKLAAVNENGYAIEFIKDPTEEMIITAINRKVGCINYIQDKYITRDILKLVFSINGEFINSPLVKRNNHLIDDELLEIAVSNNPKSIRDLDNKYYSDHLMEIALSKEPELIAYCRDIDEYIIKHNNCEESIYYLIDRKYPFKEEFLNSNFYIKCKLIYDTKI